MKPVHNNASFKLLFFVFVAVATINFPLPTTSARPMFSPPNTPAPFYLGGMVVFDTQLSLGFAWIDNSNDETGFRVEEKLGVDGAYSVVATLGADSTNVGGIFIPRDGNTYFFRVKAFNASGESSPSNEVGIDTDTASPVPPPMPNAPSSLQIAGFVVFPTQLSLGFTWSDNNNDETGFRLEQKQGYSGAFSVVATLPANSTNVGGIIIPRDGKTYYFRVKAFNANGESDPSNTVSIVATP